MWKFSDIIYTIIAVLFYIPIKITAFIIKPFLSPINKKWESIKQRFKKIKC